MIPIDGEQITANGIYHANLEMIRSADAVLANLNAFRGIEPDSGTCFEVGFATALGKDGDRLRLADGRLHSHRHATTARYRSPPTACASKISDCRSI